MRGTRRFERPEPDKIYIYGKHALMEALTHAPHAVKKAFLSGEAGEDKALRELLNKSNIPSAGLKGGDAPKMVGEDSAHQGVIAIVDPLAILEDFNDFLGKITPGPGTALVLLDELTDPQNVGAIIRSAAAFGASGVLIPGHNQAGITGAVVKASAGMVFSVPIVAIGNVNQTILKLKEEGFKAYALAMKGARDLSKERFDEPAVFVVGNEGRGVHQKTMEHSDIILKIPMSERAESLNASVSAAVVLYAWSAAHPEALSQKHSRRPE
jgi:23S rRNA (guanosine2251-2'-O)-methyltransferase